MNTTKLNQEVLETNITQAYEIAKQQGFYPDNTNISHELMMIIMEMGEVVQADRKNRHGQMETYNAQLQETSDKVAYEEHLENTVESEMADVAIRIMSLVGYLEMQPHRQHVNFFDDETINKTINYHHFIIKKAHETIPLYLFRMVQEITYSALEVSPYWLLAGKLQNILCNIYAFAIYQNIDLLEHIRLKMQYNEGREYKHGYKY